MGRYRISNRYVLDEALGKLDRDEQEVLLQAFDALVEDPDTPQVDTFPFRADNFGRDRLIAALPLGYYLVFKIHEHGIMPSTAPCISLYKMMRLDDFGG